MKKLFFLVAVLGIAVLPLSDAYAGSPVSVGIEAGIVNTDVEGLDNTWMGGVYVDLGLPLLNWYLEPFINYWSWSESASISGIESSFSDWTIGGNLKMAIPTATMIRPFIGVGASAHLLKREIDTGTVQGSFDVSDTKLGLQFGGGLNIDAGETWSLVGQSWYHVVDGFNQWSIRGGIAWTL